MKTKELKLVLVLFIFASFFISCTLQKEKGASDEGIINISQENTLPPNKKWKLVWSDEFNGTELDSTKWNYRLDYWGYKSPTFTQEGVELDGEGHLRINLIRKGDDFYSAHLQTGSNTFDIPRDPDAKGPWLFGKKKSAKFMHRFGYYEIRCKLPKYDGWHAAF